MLAFRTTWPPSRKVPRTVAHGCSLRVPASCPPAASTEANPASAWASTTHGSSGSGNANRPAASVRVSWLPQSWDGPDCCVGVAIDTLAFATGLPAVSTTTPATGGLGCRAKFWVRGESSPVRNSGPVWVR